jgi:hypothetical protein
MGAFKLTFHQANFVDGGFVYMRACPHIKKPDMLQEDLKWWMKDQQYGLYPAQCRLKSSGPRLAPTSSQVNCASLQQAPEKTIQE